MIYNIYNDGIKNDNKENEFIINTDQNMIKNTNISIQIKDENQKEENKKNLEKGKKKYKEKNKQNIINIKKSNDNQIDSIWDDTISKNNKTQENKTLVNKMDNDSTESMKESLNNNDNAEEKEESEDDDLN